jgi:Flp pilus assembly protein TadG
MKRGTRNSERGASKTEQLGGSERAPCGPAVPRSEFRVPRWNRRGLAAAEFAILLPFLALLFVVTVDYCRVFVATQTVQAAADAGVRYASGVAVGTSGSSTTNAQNAAVTAGTSLSPALTTDNVDVSIQNNTATVTVTWTFKTFIPYAGMPATVVLTRSAVAPVAPKPFDGASGTN